MTENFRMAGREGVAPAGAPKGKKYLYLVRENTYSRFSINSGNYVTKYSGSIQSASRVLYNVETKKTHLIMEREGERFGWAPILATGYVNRFSNIGELGMSAGDEASVYAGEVGARNINTACDKFSDYLIRNDIRPFTRAKF